MQRINVQATSDIFESNNDNCTFKDSDDDLEITRNDMMRLRGQETPTTKTTISMKE